MANHIILYLLSFAGIWLGAGLVVKSVQRLSHSLKLSSFSISFLLLGFFTSISELSVGINSVLQNDPEIYVGNLIGASIVLFIMVIPLLAVVDRSVAIAKEFRGFNLIFSLLVVAAPVILAVDGKIDHIDGLISIIIYGFLAVRIESRKSFLDRVKDLSRVPPVKTLTELLQILVGVVIIFIASKFVVDQTLYFSQILKVSPFLISLLLVSIGTNIPELSLVFRSLFIKNHQIAFGDYIGSAAFNTFLLGFLTLLYGRPVLLTNSYLTSLLFLILGLSAFYYFARTKNSLSRVEGLILLVIYGLFIVTELFIHI